MITLKVRKAVGWKESMKGLLGRPKGTYLLLKTRFGIHTFGMKYPIDVVVVDDKNTVQVLKSNLKPNQIFLWNPKWDTVLELPEGFISKNNIMLHEKVLYT